MKWLRNVLALSAVAAACSVGTIPLEGKACNDAHPCLGPYECVNAVCRSTKADGGGPDGGGPNGALAPPRGLCSDDGWCFDLPVPQGQTLADVFVVSSEDLTAVGAAGTVLRLKNGGWAREPTGTSEDLTAVSPDGAGGLWAAGNTGTLLRRGVADAWSTVPSPTTSNLRDLWVAGPNKALAVGEAGTLLSWNGTAWTALNSGTSAALNGVWGASATEAWAVGDGGALLRIAGNTVTAVNVTAADLTGVWGFAVNDVWAVGAGGTVLRYNGTSWSPMASGVTVNFRKVWGTDPNHLWATTFDQGIYFRGTEGWSLQAAVGFGPIAPHGSAADNVWVVGVWGNLVRWNGSTWEPRSEGFPDFLTGVAGTDSRDVWAVGAFFGSALNFDGVKWSAFPLPAEVTTFSDGPSAVWSASRSDAWLVTSKGRFAHWDGVTWSAVNVTNARPLRAVWGSGPADVWAAGDDGALFRWNGATWAAVGSGSSASFNAVWGTSPNDVWLAARSGALLHWDGTAWTPTPSGTTAELRGLWGAAANDVWAVGEGVILHWDGATWTPVEASGYGLTGVHGTGPNEVYAGTNQGVVMRWDGGRWAAQRTGAERISLSDVAAFGPGEVFIVGNGGVVLRPKP